MRIGQVQSSPASALLCRAVDPPKNVETKVQVPLAGALALLRLACNADMWPTLAIREHAHQAPQ
eukprot:3161876-Pyramimonas_sp.AAC.1